MDTLGYVLRSEEKMVPETAASFRAELMMGRGVVGVSGERGRDPCTSSEKHFFRHCVPDFNPRCAQQNMYVCLFRNYD